jgi:alpha-N-arabinofuranosidase
MIRRLALIIAVLLMPLAGPHSEAQSLSVNGDFARGGNPPAGWYLDKEAAEKGTIRLSAPPAGISGQVLELAPDARNIPSEKPLALGQMLPAGLIRGHSLEISAELAENDGAHAVLIAAIVRSDGVTKVLQLRASGAAFAVQRGRLSVPDDSAIQGLILVLSAEGTVGSARFAAVRVESAASEVAPAQAAAREPSSDIPAQVRIDIAHPLRTIPRELFGTNIEVIRDANGLWDGRNERLDPQLVSLARDLGPSLIRFPGGGWSDAYDWRNGIGPQAKRIAAPTSPGSPEINRNNFGTDEALAFAVAIGGHLLVTVNVASGTAELAAEWVRYVNGEGGRASRAGRVTYWEIGNEPYIKGDLMGAHMPPERYADRVIDFAAAMRAVDPGIKIAAVGLHNFGRYRLNSHNDWNEVVLRRAGAAIDLLTVHDGYAPLVGNGRGLDPTEVYTAMWAAPKLIRQNLEDTWHDVERFAPDQAHRIGLGVTEWAPSFAVDPASPWIDHTKTLGSAVFVASMLKVFAEDPHLLLANFFKLNEGAHMGWIGRRGGAWVPTAPYDAFRMVSREMGSRLLTSTVDVAHYDSPAAGAVSRVSDVPYLDVLATAADGGNSITALLINKHMTAAISARVVLAGCTGVATLHTETLTGDAADANSGTELPQLPGLKWAVQQRLGPQGRFDRGGEGEIRLDRGQVADPGPEVTVRVPPHSVTLAIFGGVRPS